MRSLSLSGSDWTLTGYWHHQWRMRRGDFPIRPSVMPIPATVPGAVHADLLRAGVIGDWQDGLNAERCEWINNREWSLRRSVTVPAEFTGRLTLECDGLDYSGHLLVDGQEIAQFEGTHLRHCFDLTDRVVSGRAFELEFIFHQAPQIDAVYGFTSQTRIFKPRFGYYWDWCSRLVNVGIWQDVRLVSRGSARFHGCRVLPRVGDDLTSAYIDVIGEIEGLAGGIRYSLVGPDGREVCGKVGPPERDARAVKRLRQEAPAVLARIPVEQVKLWWPATHGEQPLYRLTLEVLDTRGHVSDRLERTVGFKQVRWLKNPGAPADARPYLCEINGRQIFLRGVNWVPLSPLYGLPTAGQYETFVRLYRNMNANLLRVWGGGILERPEFYEACDRLGLLAWQEFPLSSSGIDNWPPEAPEVIEHLQKIAAEYIERRAHHACHLLWCGGNELQGTVEGSKVGCGKPVDESHPLMARWQKLVETLDPGKRFLVTSPSGPRFYAAPEDFGKGLHHHTHGPWGNLPLDGRYAYFNGDDTLFRTETGAPGCSSMEALERHRGDQELWPPRTPNRHWLNPAGHWIPWDEVAREFGPIPDHPAELPVVVKASQYLQAESYRYAAEATRRRFPGCGAFVIWMGHDSVHCTSNNSVIQIDAAAKPAYDWLQRAFAGRHVSLRHYSISYPPGVQLAGEVWIHRDEADTPASGLVRVNVRSLDGRILETKSVQVSGEGPSLRVDSLDWQVPSLPEQLFVVELIWEAGAEAVLNRYLLSRQMEHPLQPLLLLSPVVIGASMDRPGCVRVQNDSAGAAIGVRLVPVRLGEALLCHRNNLILFAGETVTIEYWTPKSAGRGGAGLVVECFNQAGHKPQSVTGQGG